jgi:hypothetical protein
VSENRTTDAPRDPAFAAVARVLDAEKAFTAAVAVKDYSRDVGLDEARAVAGLNYPFVAQLAGVAEHHVTRLHEMLVERHKSVTGSRTCVDGYNAKRSMRTFGT